MKSTKYCNIYIGMWCLYFLQGTLYEVGGWLSRILIVVLLVSSLYSYYLSVAKTFLPKPLRIMAWLVIIWTIYGVSLILLGSSSLAATILKYDYLKNIYISILPIYSFYIFAKNGVLTEDLIKKWIFVFIAVAIGCFYSSERESLLMENKDEITNNTSYFVLAIVPLLPLFWRKPFLQYSLLAVCMFFVLMGYKRGAIIAGFLCSFWMIVRSILYTEKNNISGKKQGRKVLTRIIATGILLGAAYYYVVTLIETSDYFNLRVNQSLEGNTSGRDWMYENLYQIFMHSDAMHFFFGYGGHGTLVVSDNFAHNDWLEIAINNGLFTLLLYFAYWISLLIMVYKAKKASPITMMMGMFAVIYLLKTFFSMSYNSIPPFASCALGFAMAKIEYGKSKIF